MPTYDYRCDSCGHEFEIFQSMSDPAKRKCPECEKPKLQRIIGAGAGIIFKGSGFYQTDYRSDSYRQGAEADKKAKTEKKSASDSPADSKSSGSKGDSKPKSSAPKKND